MENLLLDIGEIKVTWRSFPGNVSKVSHEALWEMVDVKEHSNRGMMLERHGVEVIWGASWDRLGVYFTIRQQLLFIAIQRSASHLPCRYKRLF
jgi:hypothetical protein